MVVLYIYFALFNRKVVRCKNNSGKWSRITFSQGAFAKSGQHFSGKTRENKGEMAENQ